MLAMWGGLYAFTLAFFMRPFWFRKFPRLSYTKLIVLAIGLHLFFAMFITWGQYYVWQSNQFTQIFLSLPLPGEAPLPYLLEWTRRYFEHPFGYFAYYSFGHFWLELINLFTVTGIFYGVLKFWQFYRAGFLSEGPEIILLLSLLVGWPGVLLFIPAGLVLSVLFYVFLYTRGERRVHLEPVFMFLAPFLLFLRN